MNKKSVQVQKQAKDKLSTAQKKFNLLIKKIDSKKVELVAWQTLIPEYQQKQAEIQPVRDELHRLQVQAVQTLDAMFGKEKLGKKQKEMASDIIVSLCDGLLSKGYDEVKPLYEKHAQSNYDEDLEHDKNQAADMLVDMFQQEMGVKLDIDPSRINPGDPDATMRYLFEQMQKHQEVSDEESNVRRKTAKQLAKEAREQEEDAKIAKSLQTVYRQLVAALHPDREPDPVERERKTELMKQVTVAYEKKDLLKLFELQLSIEQIDQNHINNIAEDRLKHFIKVLQSQLDEIEMEMEAIQTRFRIDLDIPPFYQLSRQTVWAELEIQRNSLEAMLEDIRYDLANFADVTYFKAWIKKMREAHREIIF